jgi:hypothetical protein
LWADFWPFLPARSHHALLVTWADYCSFLNSKYQFVSDVRILQLAGFTPVAIPFRGPATQKVRQESAMQTMQRIKAGW